MPTRELISARAATQSVVWRHGQPIGVTQLLHDAWRLSEALPARARQINLCSDRYLFLLGVIAAAYRGHRLALPASKAPDDLHQIAHRRADSYLLTDHPEAYASLEPLRLQPEAWGNPTATSVSAPPEIPKIASDRPLVTLYTSGSTGTATAHRKRWGTLVRSAELTGERLGLAALDGASAVATVPAQHMFGFETSIMLPLRCGLAVAAEQPLLPLDIAHALARLPAPRILITTPLHLRYCLAEAGSLPELAFILSATAPMDQALAAAAEQRFGAPVLEIFGSTETGAMATRHPARDEPWQLLSGFRLDPRDARLWLDADHFPAPHPLNDRLEIIDADRFRLLGRDADLIKIAGKRESLADLNHKLLSVPGIEDAVIFLPEADNGGRLAALVVAPETNAHTLLDALRQCMDPVFLPRPLLHVPSLPRNDTGKLPRRALLAMFDDLRGRR